MRVCIDCWDVPCSCGHESFMEIDDKIVPEICMLNKKGYITCFCCEGHRDWEVFDLYVMLRDKMEMPVPKPLKLDRNKKAVRFCKWNEDITDQDIKNARLVFQKWVLELPKKE